MTCLPIAAALLTGIFVLLCLLRALAVLLRSDGPPATAWEIRRAERRRRLGIGLMTDRKPI